jgi:hypothetical protein
MLFVTTTKSIAAEAASYYRIAADRVAVLQRCSYFFAVVGEMI